MRHAARRLTEDALDFLWADPLGDLLPTHALLLYYLKVVVRDPRTACGDDEKKAGEEGASGHSVHNRGRMRSGRGSGKGNL